MIKKINFSELPFVYELKASPKNDEGIPDTLPFNLAIDEKYDLVKQEYNSYVDECLTKAYKISSILGGNITEDEIGIGYANSMLDFINQNSNALNGKDVLDIGCGTGYLLSKLKEVGCNVWGIEPGQQADIGGKKYNVPIIKDFFPSDKLNQKFDLIICSLVLEHITNPESFVEKIKLSLKENGNVIIGVPNCLPYIESGDISMLFHEHWSYFTPNSLSKFLKMNGAANLQIQESSYGGLLYAKFEFNNKAIQLDSKNINEGASYLEKIDSATKKLKTFFKTNTDKSIGIYVPGRLINFLISEKVSTSNLRFFDDNINTYNHYFPGIGIKVENYSDLKNKPTDIVVVMSSFFGQKIRDKILNGISIKESQIVLWESFYK